MFRQYPFAWCPALCCVLLLLVAASASAQQVTVSVPQHTVSDGFFENMGTSWGLSGPNWNLSVFGGPNQAAPPFGGFDSGAGANFGAGFRGNGVNGFFAANFSQGYRQSFTSQVPSVTLQNGVPGYFSDSSLSPFVISNIPVVGGFPAVSFVNPAAPPPVYPGQGYGHGNPAVLQALKQVRRQRQTAGEDDPFRVVEAADAQGPLDLHRNARAERDDLVLLGGDPSEVLRDDAAEAPAGAGGRSSSAARPAVSVGEARRLHAAEQAEQDQEVLAYLERGRNAEAEGKPNVAKIYYQMAYRRASEEMKPEVAERLRLLESGR